jgi:hypothetical protein
VLAHVVANNAKQGTMQAPPTWRTVFDCAATKEAVLFAIADDWLSYVMLIHAELGAIRLSTSACVKM